MLHTSPATIMGRSMKWIEELPQEKFEDIIVLIAIIALLFSLF